MRFILEAFRRRPLESTAFAYFRASSSTIFGALFLVYCIYLIIQIEMCSGNSSMTIVRCDLVHMDWSMSTIPNCYDYITVGEAPSDTPSRCYLFDSGDTFKYGVVEEFEPTTSDIRRIDIYWKIDSILNSSLASIAVPSITLELYTEGFSRWNPPNDLPNYLEKDLIVNGGQASSSQNFTTILYFTSSLYRAILPRDPLSLLGFAHNYIDFPTVDEVTQLEWPLQENENITRGDYHGVFAVQMANFSIDIKSEQRQHTILAAIALAGGAYGAFLTLYILLFGTLRLSPFGVFHQIPIIVLYTVEVIRKKRRKNSRLNDDDLNGNRTDRFLLDDFAQPPKLDIIYISTSTNIPTDSGTIQQSHTSTGNNRNVQLTDSSSWDRDCRSDDSSSCANSNDEQPSQDPNNGENPAIINRIHQLERQVSELQQVLREYYIDMSYLDNHRNMRRH
ncbi:hypothetical protein BDC45DRAFT_32767 [Circinella umbellata]|nr:hypothetical protein BDC45DRAFT_32767 [Circinella umbellata]